MSATDRYSHQLLYATVRQRLLDDIAQGVYQAGQQIPTENELCTQYNVSRITIRKAISDLVADGVLIRWQGKGTFVQSQKVENALLTGVPICRNRLSRVLGLTLLPGMERSENPYCPPPRAAHLSLPKGNSLR